MLFGNLQRLYSSSNLITGLNLLTLEGLSRPSNPVGHARSRSWCESMNWCSVVREKTHIDIVHRYQILKTMIEDDREDDNNESSNVNHLESLSGSSSVNTLLGTSAVVPSSKTSSIQKQQFQHGKKKPQTVFVGNISFRVINILCQHVWDVDPMFEVMTSRMVFTGTFLLFSDRTHNCSAKCGNACYFLVSVALFGILHICCSIRNNVFSFRLYIPLRLFIRYVFYSNNDPNCSNFSV